MRNPNPNTSPRSRRTRRDGHSQLSSKWRRVVGEIVGKRAGVVLPTCTSKNLILKSRSRCSRIPISPTVRVSPTSRTRDTGWETYIDTV